MTPMEIMYKRGHQAFDLINYPTWVHVLGIALIIGAALYMCISFFQWKRNNC